MLVQSKFLIVFSNGSLTFTGLSALNRQQFKILEKDHKNFFINKKIKTHYKSKSNYLVNFRKKYS